MSRIETTSANGHSESFRVKDWREIFDIYPDQWLAIAVDEITPDVGITLATS
jgi:hypothetical protein